MSDVSEEVVSVVRVVLSVVAEEVVMLSAAALKKPHNTVFPSRISQLFQSLCTCAV